jgi:hypothetical protein
MLEREAQRFTHRRSVADDAAFGRVGLVVDERIDESFVPRHA